MDWFWLYTVQGQQLQLAYDSFGYLVDTAGGQYVVDQYGIITTQAGVYIGNLQDAAESAAGLGEWAGDFAEDTRDYALQLTAVTAMFYGLIAGAIIWYVVK